MFGFDCMVWVAVMRVPLLYVLCVLLFACLMFVKSDNKNSYVSVPVRVFAFKSGLCLVLIVCVVLLLCVLFLLLHFLCVAVCFLMVVKTNNGNTFVVVPVRVCFMCLVSVCLFFLLNVV